MIKTTILRVNFNRLQETGFFRGSDPDPGKLHPERERKKERKREREREREKERERKREREKKRQRLRLINAMKADTVFCIES